MSTIQYNRAIRKIIVAFGNLFDSIPLVRYNSDNSEAERMIVPIVYAAKELYVKRLEEDLDLDKKVQTTLPRLSYEMTGLRYDPDRKQNTNIKNFTQTASGVVAQNNPVPYDFDFSLYLYTRNIEDAHQILEYVLPYFTPDYTLRVNMIPEMGIIKEVPILLENITSDIRYEGDRNSDTRVVIWTLDFKVKGFIFGKTSTVDVIKTSITNVLNNITADDIVVFNMKSPGIGEYQIGEVVYQGFSYQAATATAKVTAWSNGVLHLSNINGNFVSSHPIIGSKTNANYIFNNYVYNPNTQYANIVVTANTSVANANLYTYHTVITENKLTQ